MRRALPDRTRLRRLLAAALLYLMFGAPLALAGMAFAAVLACAFAAHRLIERFAPPNLFVYVLGEAFLTGALVTLFVVYRHEWVSTFDDSRYLAR